MVDALSDVVSASPTKASTAIVVQVQYVAKFLFFSLLELMLQNFEPTATFFKLVLYLLSWTGRKGSTAVDCKR